MLRRLLLCSIALTTGACAGAPGSDNQDGEPVEATEQQVVYGDDDRQEVYEYSPSAWADQVAGFTVALMETRNLDERDPERIVVTGDTLDQIGVCPDERFADQLTAAFCSGTLIAPDLVLTAGHCVETLSGCQATRFVFDYYMTGPTTMASIEASDVYRCDSIVARQLDAQADFAIVRLTRPALGRTPASIVREGVVAPRNDALVVNGFPTGLPIKIADGANVRTSRAETLDFFIANLDTFVGNSGSGVFDEEAAALVGILVEGEVDYVMTPQGCGRVNQCENDECSGEKSTYAYQGVEALCRAEPNHPLCGCGDAVCDADADETTVTCAADCGAACGDGICNGGEDQATCAADCGTCGNGTCDEGESPGTCCSDCGCGGETSCVADICVGGAGDTCSNALIVDPVGTVTLQGSTRDASNSDSASGSACSASASGPERIYEFSLTTDTTVAAQVVGYDTIMFLRSTCDDPTSELACNDDDSSLGLGSRFTTTLPAGTYYLFVDGFGASSGTFELTLDFGGGSTTTGGSDGDGDSDGDGGGCAVRGASSSGTWMLTVAFAMVLARRRRRRLRD